VIAHRLSTIREADQILVIDGGRVVERGPHDSLLAADGLYADLYRTQFARQGATLPEPAGPVSPQAPPAASAVPGNGAGGNGAPGHDAAVNAGSV